jgi:hypothetical protein
MNPSPFGERRNLRLLIRIPILGWRSRRRRGRDRSSMDGAAFREEPIGIGIGPGVLLVGVAENPRL